MNVPPEAVEAVRDWMDTEFPEAHVEHGEIFDRDVVLFRASDEAGSYELEVSEEAFRDLPTETVIADLRAQQVGARLRRDPTMRLRYYSRRDVPHLETRYLICDGKTYRIVRDAEHNVRIYDSEDQVLERTPPGPRVMSSSIFRKLEQRWCDEIRSLRGPNQ